MRRLLVALLACETMGCGTSYQPVGWGGGYSDSQLSERVFEIRFAGNGYTGHSTVEAYALRRAAEVAAARGFAGFVEMQDRTNTDQSLAYYNNQANIVSKHSATKRIYLLTAEEMRQVPAAINARMILARWPAPAPAVAASSDQAERCRQVLANSFESARYPEYSAHCREILTPLARPAATAPAPAPAP